MNDEYLDLNGAEQGTALPVTLDPGLTVVPVSISLAIPPRTASAATTGRWR
ncbi:MAG: hypothetical protein ACYSUF_14950 [Planctomycetota bacterium]|jgi:hypothetical protein